MRRHKLPHQPRRTCKIPPVPIEVALRLFHQQLLDLVQINLFKRYWLWKNHALKNCLMPAIACLVR